MGTKTIECMGMEEWGSLIRQRSGECFPQATAHPAPSLLTKKEATQTEPSPHTYLLPVKNEPFCLVIPILILLEKFTAWRRSRKSRSVVCAESKQSWL